MKATQKQIAEWQEQYGKGNIRQLSANGKFCYVSDPSVNLSKMKLLIAARRKSAGHLVDAIINNCWLGGDEDFKTDEQLKLGIEGQVDDIMELPDSENEELDNGNVIITVNNISIEVRKASRPDLRYAEDRNKENKPLATWIYLLERIATDENQLRELRTHVREYISVLFAIQELKDKRDVEIKKF